MKRDLIGLFTFATAVALGVRYSVQSADEAGWKAVATLLYASIFIAMAAQTWQRLRDRDAE